MTECSAHVAFDFHPQLPVVTTCGAPESSSDGGVLLLRALDEGLGLTAGFAAHLPDGRDPRFVQHPRLEQLRQRVYQIALGYEDCNDCAPQKLDAQAAEAVRARPDWTSETTGPRIDR